MAKNTLIGTAGKVALSDVLREGARMEAKKDFAQAEADEFCGDEVRDIILPKWLGDPELVLPVAQLRELGLVLSYKRPVHMYATCGVEPHVDAMDGLSVCVVLHADGFTFKQGKTSLKLAAGDWFIFDDATKHAVTNTNKSTTLLIITAALRAAD